MKQIGWLLSALMWLLVSGSIIVLTGGLFGRPLLLAAVPTGSMLPVLVPGDMIVVLPTWASRPVDAGDMIVFKTPQDREWVVHRIIGGSAAEGFVTKGDANLAADIPLVFPRDIAGVVPQTAGGALRLPRLGLLSLSEGPFFSPVVAGVALVMGVYLLVMDLRPRGGITRLKGRLRVTAKPVSVFGIYLGLAGTVFLSTLIPAWTLSSVQHFRYEVVEQVSLRNQRSDQYVKGRPYMESVPVSNPSPLPIVAVFASGDPNLTLEPRYALIPPKGSASFQVTIQTPELGRYSGKLNTGIFLPFLPPAVLGAMGRLNMALAALVVSLVPAVLMLAIAVFDERARHYVVRVRSRIALLLGI